VTEEEAARLQAEVETQQQVLEEAQAQMQLQAAEAYEVQLGLQAAQELLHPCGVGSGLHGIKGGGKQFSTPQLTPLQLETT
jgi:hypothetical protein